MVVIEDLALDRHNVAEQDSRALLRRWHVWSTVQTDGGSIDSGSAALTGYSIIALLHSAHPRARLRGRVVRFSGGRCISR